MKHLTIAFRLRNMKYKNWKPYTNFNQKVTTSKFAAAKVQEFETLLVFYINT